MMPILKKPGNGFPRREAPFDEKANVRLLVEEMSRYWSTGSPPQAEMAKHTVHETGFYCLKNRSLMMAGALTMNRLTDLGAGDPVDMAHFAMEYGVSEYVAVDGYRDYSASGLHAISGIRLVNMDMLEYLSGQPDGSTNIVMNAIDWAVLRGPSRLIEGAYAEYLLRNIARVLPRGGIAFGSNSPVLDGLSGMGLERLKRTDISRVSEFEALFIKPA
jgi:hypothetical protein